MNRLSLMATWRPRLMLTFSAVVLFIAVVFVFVRASIEVGEERLWVIIYLFFVPVLLALSTALALNRLNLASRIGVGFSVVVAVAVLLYQTVLFADVVYENPERFRKVLPVILKAENIYLSVIHDPERYARHQKKLERWREFE